MIALGILAITAATCAAPVGNHGNRARQEIAATEQQGTILRAAAVRTLKAQSLESQSIVRLAGREIREITEYEAPNRFRTWREWDTGRSSEVFLMGSSLILPDPDRPDSWIEYQNEVPGETRKHFQLLLVLLSRINTAVSDGDRYTVVVGRAGIDTVDLWEYPGDDARYFDVAVEVRDGWVQSAIVTRVGDPEELLHLELSRFNRAGPVLPPAQVQTRAIG